MKNLTIGIIGNGFVGSSISHGFRHYCRSLKIFDKDPDRSTHNFSEVLKCDFVFVCVPTPMSSTGAADLSLINQVFEKAELKKSKASFVIKSTVPIGTTDDLSNKYISLNIFHSPEFLTARSAKIDFICPSRNIIGYPSKGDCNNKSSYCYERLNILKDFFKNRFPGVPCMIMKSKESEFVKYIANCFFATKVSFFNEMFLLSKKLGLDWQNLIKGVMSDGRIGISHFQVPGHDGDMGFGGTCFPKDINSLISIMKDNDLDPLILQAAWDRNLDVRKNKDWEYESAAVSKPKNKQSDRKYE